jgi:pimeloyl-ACP methyl ester carboxylesterase
MSESPLYFRPLNPQAPQTLLLLHGGFTSHHEWDLVSPYLSNYHLLIPDLPSHGTSTSSKISFNIPDTAALLADLVSKNAKDGKVDVVGMSMGGYIAIYMAQKYPGLVEGRGLFVSGCGMVWPRPGSWRTWGMGFVMFLSLWVSTRSTAFFGWACKKMGLQVTDEMIADTRGAASHRLGQSICGELAEDMRDSQRNWGGMSERVKARTCVVAGVLEDGEKDCLERGRQLKRGNGESRAFKVEGKKHAWDLQDPELFARGVKAWLEHEELPEGFVELD